jgi:hypothetical protein
MSDLLIAVEVTNQEADVFRKMRESGSFEIRDGSVTLHFGHSGRLIKLERKLSTTFSQMDSQETHDIL